MNALLKAGSFEEDHIFLGSSSLLKSKKKSYIVNSLNVLPGICNTGFGIGCGDMVAAAGVVWLSCLLKIYYGGPGKGKKRVCTGLL